MKITLTPLQLILCLIFLYIGITSFTPPVAASYKIERCYFDGHMFYVLVNSSGQPIAFKE